MNVSKNSIAFYREVARLKTLPRTGWVKRGIPNPETVAEHMYRSQLIAFDLAKETGIDPFSCAHMMMIHDLPEARAGDITPVCGVSKEEKTRLEMQAAKELSLLSGNHEFLDMFVEYEEKKTRRAQVCHDADQLECLMQALEYAELYPEKHDVLEDFWSYAKDRIVTDAGKKLYQKLYEQKCALPLYVPPCTDFILVNK